MARGGFILFLVLVMVVGPLISGPAAWTYGFLIKVVVRTLAGVT